MAAADKMAVTQPAASKTLKELETILGAPLFDRSGRKLKLNETGRVFQRHAGVGVAELERAQNAVLGARPTATKLTLGALPTAATDLAPRAALSFQQEHGNCILQVSTGPNWLLLSQLREAQLDLVVGRMADEDRMSGLSFEQLYIEQVAAVVRTGHPLSGPIDPTDVLEYPMIMPPKGAVISSVVRSFFISIGAGGITPAFETVSLAFGRRVLLESDAIWFISRGVVAEELARGTLRTLELDAPLLSGPVGISQREDATPSIQRAALVDHLRKAAIDLRTG